MSRAPRIQGQSGERTCKEVDGEKIMFRLKSQYKLPHTVQSMNLMLESLSLDKSRLQTDSDRGLHDHNSPNIMHSTDMIR